MLLTLALVLTLLVGLSLGLLGSGGSTITLPVLVYVARIPVQQAVAMSLVVVGGTAAFGAYLQGRRRGIDLRAAAIFAATGAPGAFLGARLTHLVSGPVLLLLFGLLMLAAGARLLGRHGEVAGVHACQVGRCVVAGLTVGVLTGFLGVGGGFLIVPALLLFAGIDMKRAVPTSLAVIACNAAGGLAGQISTTTLDWPATGAFLAVALVGMLGGSALTGRLSSGALQRVFAWAILLLGLGIVVRNVWLMLA